MSCMRLKTHQWYADCWQQQLPGSWLPRWVLTHSLTAGGWRWQTHTHTLAAGFWTENLFFWGAFACCPLVQFIEKILYSRYILGMSGNTNSCTPTSYRPDTSTTSTLCIWLHKACQPCQKGCSCCCCRARQRGVLHQLLWPWLMEVISREQDNYTSGHTY